MENMISLGSFEVLLAAKGGSTQIGGTQECIGGNDFWIKYLKDLLKYHGFGFNFKTDDVDLNGIDALTEKLQHSILPKVVESSSMEEIYEHAAPLYKAIPTLKEELVNIGGEGAGSSGPSNAMGLPIMPIIYGLAFLLGLYDGLRNKKKINGN